MNSTADIYTAEILRAVLGKGAGDMKVEDPARLAQIADHLAECEEAKRILRAKGYGFAGASVADVARSVPDNVKAILKSIFRPRAHYPSIGEVQDEWSLR